MRKIKRFWWIGCLLLVVGICLAYLFRVNTADNMSLTYSRSASTISSEEPFYIKDGELYFYNKLFSYKILHLKNDWVGTFAQLPKSYGEKSVSYEKFIILNDESLITQVKDQIYLLKLPDGEMQELWQGNCVGYDGTRIYFTNDTTLYASEIGQNEPEVIITFEKLMAYYSDAIVYKSEEGICQLFFERPKEPQLLTTGWIPWSVDTTAFPLDFAYIYTSDYALRIGTHAIDMFIYETGEMKRIYETDSSNRVAMAVSATPNEICVSRQLKDIALWDVKDATINGTYKYDIRAGSWTKISKKTYYTLGQFDEKHLYGFNSESLLGRVHKFDLSK